MRLPVLYDVAGQVVAWLDTETGVTEDFSATMAEALDDLRAALDPLLQARQAATDDVPAAEALQASALTLRDQATGQATAVRSFVPSATYSPAQLAQVRDQLATVLDRQALILKAFADFYAYRAAVDRNAIITDNAIIRLAQRQVGG